MSVTNSSSQLKTDHQTKLEAKTAEVSSRVVSLDIFRGFTMLVMIFVNDLAGVDGLPWWNYHLPANVNGMTYVDMVFPAFLFIVGMSIPLAVQRRLDKGAPPRQLWTHVISRALSLLILGLALANGRKGNPQLMGMEAPLWQILILAGAVLFWNVYPKSGERQFLYRVLKFAGLALMAAMFAIFRRTTPDGQIRWLDFSYVEILGLIGWAYLAVCILYIPTRRWRFAPIAWLVALCGLNVLSKLGYARPLNDLPGYLWPFGTGALASITMAGVVASLVFFNKSLLHSFKEKAVWAMGYTAVLLVCGWLLRPLGISKIRATPTWCLYCAAASTLLFLVLYWVCDAKQINAWAAILKPAGSNTLLTYLLPYFFYATVGSYYFSLGVRQGWPGAIVSLLFTGLILAISALLTKARVRMQL